MKFIRNVKNNKALNLVIAVSKVTVDRLVDKGSIPVRGSIYFSTRIPLLENDNLEDPKQRKGNAELDLR
jgi:hypothetical protein